MKQAKNWFMPKWIWWAHAQIVSLDWVCFPVTLPYLCRSQCATKNTLQTIANPSASNIQAATCRNTSCRHSQASGQCHAMGQHIFNCHQKQLHKHSKPQMCICLDSYNLNPAIDWERSYYRTPGYILHQVSQAMMFTTVDFSKGFYHIKLNEASSFLITFNTIFERFWFTIIPFCLNVIGDTFTYKLVF